MSAPHWKPGASLEGLRERARTLAAIRAFFADRGVLEVSTPCITRTGITDPNIDSLALADGSGYLRTSPEYAHKRLLAAGFGDLFEIGPVFRAGEHGRYHRREFTLLEWYRLDWGWRDLAEEIIALVTSLSEQPWQLRYVDWHEAFEAATGLDPSTASEASLREATNDLPADCDRAMQLDWIFATRVQPALPGDALTIIHDYPAEQAALARLKPGRPELAERFEVFLGNLEIANGYRELTSADEQRARFCRDNARRRALDLEPMPIDEALLAAMNHGLPECSGVALGIERLLMALNGQHDIAATQAFA